MQEVKFSHSDKVISGGRAQKFNCSQAYLAITALPFSTMALHSAATRLLVSLSVFSHIWKHSAKAPLISCHNLSAIFFLRYAYLIKVLQREWS